MKNTTFTIFEAIGNADDDLIAETQEYPALVKTKKKKRSFRYKAIGAVAACLAVVIGVTAVLFYPRNNSATDNKNTFFLTAYAAESTDDEVLLKNDSRVHIGECKLDKDNISVDNELNTFIVSADWTFPLRCHGENIKSIRYSVQNGVFRFSNSKSSMKPYYDVYTVENQIMDKFQKNSEEYDSVVIPDNALYDIVAYSVDYEKQSECKKSDVYLWRGLSTKDEDLSKETVKLLERFYKHTANKKGISGDDYEKELNKLCLALVNEIEINVQVIYKDGSTDNQKIKLVLENVKNNTMYVGAKLV